MLHSVILQCWTVLLIIITEFQLCSEENLFALRTMTAFVTHKSLLNHYKVQWGTIKVPSCIDQSLTITQCLQGTIFIHDLVHVSEETYYPHFTEQELEQLLNSWKVKLRSGNCKAWPLSTMSRGRNQKTRLLPAASTLGQWEGLKNWRPRKVGRSRTLGGYGFCFREKKVHLHTNTQILIHSFVSLQISCFTDKKGNVENEKKEIHLKNF